jgi:hypothetical protein
MLRRFVLLFALFIGVFGCKANQKNIQPVTQTAINVSENLSITDDDIPIFIWANPNTTQDGFGLVETKEKKSSPKQNSNNGVTIALSVVGGLATIVGGIAAYKLVKNKKVKTTVDTKPSKLPAPEQARVASPEITSPKEPSSGLGEPPAASHDTSLPPSPPRDLTPAEAVQQLDELTSPPTEVVQHLDELTSPPVPKDVPPSVQKKTGPSEPARPKNLEAAKPAETGASKSPPPPPPPKSIIDAKADAAEQAKLDQELTPEMALKIKRIRKQFMEDQTGSSRAYQNSDGSLVLLYESTPQAIAIVRKNGATEHLVFTGSTNPTEILSQHHLDRMLICVSEADVSRIDDAKFNEWVQDARKDNFNMMRLTDSQGVVIKGVYMVERIHDLKPL